MLSLTSLKRAAKTSTIIPYHSQFIAASFILLHNSYLNYNSEGQRKGKRNEKRFLRNVHSKNKYNRGNLGRTCK